MVTASYCTPAMQDLHKDALEAGITIVNEVSILELKGGYPIIFASNVFHNSHFIQKCIQHQQQLLILYTFLNQMRVLKNIRCKDDRVTSL